MGFSYNAGDEEVSNGGGPIPEGRYQLRIMEATPGKTKTGERDKVTVNYIVVNSLKYNDRAVRFHNVTFIPQGESGDWIAKAFLKAIGQPYMGNVKVEPEAWIGKVLTAQVGINDRGYNEIKKVEAYEGAPIPETVSEPADEEQIPF